MCNARKRATQRPWVARQLSLLRGTHRRAYLAFIGGDPAAVRSSIDCGWPDSKGGLRLAPDELEPTVAQPVAQERRAAQCCARTCCIVTWVLLCPALAWLLLDVLRSVVTGDRLLSPDFAFAYRRLTTHRGWTYFVDDLTCPGRVISFWDPSAAEQYKWAARYRTEQRPLVLASARTFELHPSFVRDDIPVRSGAFARLFAGRDAADGVVDDDDVTAGASHSFFDAVWSRLRHMERTGREDFRIERDKCSMYEFFRANELPHPPVINIWRDLDAFFADVNASWGDLSQLIPSWPVFIKFCHLTQVPTVTYRYLPLPTVFIKFCHLTQGSARSTRRIKSAEHLREGIASGQFAAWARSKWEYVPDDSNRPWRLVSNRMTDKVKPGVMLQCAAALCACGRWPGPSPA